MPSGRSKLRRSAERGGTLGIALVLGVFLVASSALSYRDARLTAGLVAERQGIGLIQRVEATVGRRHDSESIRAALAAALTANHALGLTYVAVLEGRPTEANRARTEAGVPLLAGSDPKVGAPVFGNDRVRMVSGGPDGRPPRGERPLGDAPPGEPPPGEPPPGEPPPGEPPPGEPPPPFGSLETEPRPPGPFPGPPWRPIVIEFEPIGSAEAVRRALAALLLSAGAAGLLTAAAVVLAAGAARADRAEAQLAAHRHLAQLGEMSAVLAHEIRNPLASLKGHAQLLAERVSEPELAARVERVVTEAVRLENLTNDLLDFARSGSIRVAPASPRALLERAIAATEPARVEWVEGGAPETWELDADRMEQVLINLIENALAVTAPPDRVAVGAETDGGGLVFTVRDRGPGVPEADRARIFEPFRTTKLRGTGLGLAVAERIVRLHGGAIEVAEAPGGGAVFRVYLPAPGGARRS